MIRTVIVVLALALASSLSLPLTTQEQGTRGIQGVLQTQSGTTVDQQSSESYVQIQPVSNQVEKLTLNPGTPEQYTGVNTAQLATVEKILIQTQPDPVHDNQQNFAVPKTENQFTNAEPPQPSYTESPVLLPIQPLSVVPVNSAGQVVQPVVVSSEPVGRMIIMAVESIRTKKFEDVGIVPETQLPYQQVAQPVPYTPVHIQGGEPNQQPYYVQPVEGQTLVQRVQAYSPVQIQPNSSPSIREQTIVPQPTGQVSYNRAPIEQGVNTVQNPQRVFSQIPENQVPYQVATAYPPVNAQSAVQPLQQQQSYIQQTVENVVQPYQQNPDNSPVQNQGFVVNPTVLDNVNQGPYQQSARVQTQQQQFNNQQDVEKYVPHQQNQSAEKPVFNIQPVTAEKQGQIYSPVQSQQQTQTEQQVIEKNVFCQKVVQANPGESVSQQGYSVQPLVGGQLENQVNYQQITQTQSVVAQAPESP